VLLDGPCPARSAAHGHRLDGTRWEVYGPHDDDPARQRTEVYWRVSEPRDPGERLTR
jgi:hypothetical protein